MIAVDTMGTLGSRVSKMAQIVFVERVSHCLTIEEQDLHFSG